MFRLFDQVQVMGGDNNGGSHFVELVEDANDLLGVCWVQVAGGLVGQNERWRSHNGSGKTDALLLATRELGGKAVGFVL